MRCPELANDLFGGDPLTVGNLQATCANSGLETCSILAIELAAIVILLYEIEANLGAFREIDDILGETAMLRTDPLRGRIPSVLFHATSLPPLPRRAPLTWGNRLKQPLRRPS